MLSTCTDPTPTSRNKVRYATLDKKRFDDLREKFDGHRVNIIVLLNIVMSKRRKGQTTILQNVGENLVDDKVKQ